MLTTWVLVWCAARHLESFRIELVDWFREEGEVEREQETPEQELAGVNVFLATTTSKGRGCLLFSCQQIPTGLRKALTDQEDILDYLIVDAINA